MNDNLEEIGVGTKAVKVFKTIRMPEEHEHPL